MNQYDHLIIASKESPEKLPPVLSLAMSQRKLFQKVTIVTSECDDKLRNKLTGSNIEIVECKGRAKSGNLMNKIERWRRFRSTALRVLNEAGPNTLLWVSGGDSALALGWAISKYTFVLQLNELYDEHPIYRLLLRHPARLAGSVVVPEVNRAAIVKMWYGLDRIPHVLPNKPYDHPRQRKIPVTDKHASKVLAELGSDARIILYQGHISRIRDVRPVAAAVHRLGGAWRFVVMGPNPLGFVDAIRGVCPGLIYIPFIPAPFHLEITSHAHIGVTVYDNSCMNNIFCAPNKIWEYAGFGIPMLCSDLPGLRFTVQTAGAGKCSGLVDIEEIMACINEIDGAHESFSKSSSKFFDSVDLDGQIGDIINDLGKGGKPVTAG